MYCLKTNRLSVCVQSYGLADFHNFLTLHRCWRLHVFLWILLVGKLHGDSRDYGGRTQNALWNDDFVNGSYRWRSVSTSAFYTGPECKGGSGSCWKFTDCNNAGDLFSKVPIPIQCRTDRCILVYEYKGMVLAGRDGDGNKGGSHTWWPYGVGDIPPGDGWQTRTIDIEYDARYRFLMFQTFGRQNCTSFLDNIVVDTAASSRASKELETVVVDTAKSTNFPALPINATPVLAHLSGLWCDDFENGSMNWLSANTSSLYTGPECKGGSGSCWQFIDCNDAGDLFSKVAIPLQCLTERCIMKYEYKGMVLVGRDDDGKKGGSHKWWPYDASDIPPGAGWRKRTIDITYDARYPFVMFQTFNRQNCTSYLDNIVFDTAKHARIAKGQVVAEETVSRQKWDNCWQMRREGPSATLPPRGSTLASADATPTPAHSGIWNDDFENGPGNWWSMNTSSLHRGPECKGGSGMCWKFIDCNDAGDLFSNVPMPIQCKTEQCTLSYEYKGFVVAGRDGDGFWGGDHQWWSHGEGDVPPSDGWQTRRIDIVYDKRYTFLLFQTSRNRTGSLNKQSCVSYLDNIVINLATDTSAPPRHSGRWIEDFEDGSDNWRAASTSGFYTGPECQGGSGSCWKFTGCSEGGDLFSTVSIPLRCGAEKCTVSYDYKGMVLAGRDDDGKKGGPHTWWPYGVDEIPPSEHWHTRTIDIAYDARYTFLMFQTFLRRNCTSYLDNIVVTANKHAAYDALGHYFTSYLPNGELVQGRIHGASSSKPRPFKIVLTLTQWTGCMQQYHAEMKLMAHALRWHMAQQLDHVNEIYGHESSALDAPHAFDFSTRFVNATPEIPICCSGVRIDDENGHPDGSPCRTILERDEMQLVRMSRVAGYLGHSQNCTIATACPE